MNFKRFGHTLYSQLAGYFKRPSDAKSLLLTGFITLSLWGVAVFLGMLTSTLGVIFASREVMLFTLPILIALGFMLLLNRPALLLGILVLRAGMDPLLEGTKIPLGNTSMGIGGLLNGLIIALTISSLLEHRSKYWRQGALYFLPFLLVLFVGVLRTPMLGDAIKQYLSILTFFCTFLIGVQLAEKNGYLYVVKIVLVSSIIPIGVGFLMLATGWKFGFTEQSEYMTGSEAGRFGGPFSHANIFAFYLLTIIVAALHVRLIDSMPRRQVILSNLVLVAALVLLGMTKTRSAWAAAAIILLAHSLILERKFLAYLIIGGVLALSMPDVQERIFDLKDERNYLAYSRLNSYEWRKVLWSDGLSAMSTASYFYGNGFVSFYNDTEKFFSLYHNHKYGAHSVYMQTFYELGIIGALCYAALNLGLLKQFIQAYQSNKVACASGLYLIIMYIAVCYSDNVLSYLVFNIYHWMMVGALFVANKINKPCITK